MSRGDGDGQMQATKIERANEMWVNMSWAERAAILALVPASGSLVQRYRACVAYVAEHLL
jgi:hypothetical protein